MSDDQSQKFDVVIVGGGPAGLTLGIALAQAHLAVAVVDAADPAEAVRATFDGRAFAIAHASARMLQALGIWTYMEETCQPMSDILVFDGKAASPFRAGGPTPFFLHFDDRDLEGFGTDEAPLGAMAETRHVRVALYQRAGELQNLSLMAPARVAYVERQRFGTTTTLEDGRIMRAPLLVAADGRGSRLRAQAGIKTVGWRYGQHGIVTTIAHERPHNGVAQEYFLPSGPFAILPLTGDRSSLVWTEKSRLEPAIMGLSDEAFLAQVQSRFGSYLGGLDVVGPRFSYPLGLQIAREMIGDRLALIGDAAHAIHPISGQGWNLGLKGVAALAEVVIEAHRLGLDIGSAPVLRQYQQWRRFDVVTLAAITDGLNRLFGNDVLPLRVMRDVGMAAINQVGPLKKLFMHHAAGMVGDLPKLLKGEAI